MVTARALVVAATLAAAPAAAQEPSSPDDRSEMSEGVDLLEQGARLLLRGLIQELGPALSEMESAMHKLESLIGDLSLYHAPEFLPNGDILLRRRSPVPVPPDPGTEIRPGEEIDL